MNARVVDMTGIRYASVVALHPTGSNKSGGYRWLFACDCGASFEASGSEVRYGRINSCPTCATIKKRAAVTKHGLSKHPLYKLWNGMKTRCLNPGHVAYECYGGRGIAVCDRWATSFENFLFDMGDRPTLSHTIERNDTDKGYEPGNCRWATREEQANNKRNNSNITIDGVTKTLAQWSREAVVTEGAIRNRLKRGVSGVDLLAPSELSSFTFNGETRTLQQWSEKVGIKHGTLSSRLYVHGWTLERALTEGVRS